MMSYIPTNMAEVHMALARIAADVAVEGLPLPELPGARTVGDLRTLRDWPRACASSSSLVTSWCG
jgi:hypothetical protein